MFYAFWLHKLLIFFRISQTNIHCLLACVSLIFFYFFISSFSIAFLMFLYHYYLYQNLLLSQIINLLITISFLYINTLYLSIVIGLFLVNTCHFSFAWPFLRSKPYFSKFYSWFKFKSICSFTKQWCFSPTSIF